MTISLSLISTILEWLIILGIPIIVIALPRGQGWKNLATRSLISVILVWIGLNIHREQIGLPVASARAAANGNMEYDGVGGNVVILFFGWIMGVFGTIIAIPVVFLGRWLIGQFRAPLPAADDKIHPHDMLTDEENPYATPRQKADNGDDPS